MNVICPNCGTEFNIPDHIYKAGRKARCTVCACIFLLPDVPEPETVMDEQPSSAVSAMPGPAPLQATQPTTGPNEPGTPSQAAARQSQLPVGGREPASAVPDRRDSSQMETPLSEVIPVPAAKPPVQQLPPQEPPVFGSGDADTNASVKDSSPAAAQAPAESTPEEPAGQSLSSAFADFDNFIRSVDQSPATPSASPSSVPETPQSAAPAEKQNSSESRDADKREQTGRDSFEQEMDAVLNHAARNAYDEEQKPPVKKKNKKLFILLAALLFMLGGAAFGAYIIFFSEAGEQGRSVKTADISPESLAKVQKMDIRTSGIKYEYVRNKKLGPILVLEGRVTNYFDTPKDYITVEARLLNSQGEVIKTRKQVCGVVLTPLQLSDLGQKELDKALSNRIEIMANNVNVLPGADVPFMVVIIYPPSDAVEMEVSVIDAADPPAAGSRGN
jgi:hypothetical protein